MKRTSTLKRKTPMARARFRQLDQPSKPWSENKDARYATRGPVGPADPEPCERDVTLVDIDGTRFVVEPAVMKVPHGSTRSDRKAKKLTRNAQRPREFEFMGWVKAQPCLMASYGGCCGVVEADHAGFEKGEWSKASDWTCIPLCSQHHHNRHAFSGPFRLYNQETMRAWREMAVALIQQQARRVGFDVPEGIR